MNGTSPSDASPALERMRQINAFIQAEADEKERIEKIRTSLEFTTVAHDDLAQSLPRQAAPAQTREGSTENLVFVNHALAPTPIGTDLRDMKSSVKRIDQIKKAGGGSFRERRENTAMQGNDAGSNIIRSSSTTLDKTGVTGQKETARSEDSNQTVFLMSSILTQRIKEMEQRMLVSILSCSMSIPIH